MKCPKCDRDLVIAKGRWEFENDDTPELPTVAYRCLDMVCINRFCDNYTGTDLSNPKIILETIRHKEE